MVTCSLVQRLVVLHPFCLQKPEGFKTAVGDSRVLIVVKHAITHCSIVGAPGSGLDPQTAQYTMFDVRTLTTLMQTFRMYRPKVSSFLVDVVSKIDCVSIGICMCELDSVDYDTFVTKCIKLTRRTFKSQITGSIHTCWNVGTPLWWQTLLIGFSRPDRRWCISYMCIEYVKRC